jgi:cyclic-di-AMP phosphodiesterase PgpH
LDSRTAFLIYLIHILICSVLVQMSYEFVLLQSVAGLTGIYSLRELSQRSQLLRTTFLIFLSYCIIWTSLQLIQIEHIKDIDYMMYVMFAINCVLILLIYPLLFIVEKSFGFTSNVTLIELSNFNQPLLRELAENAPGTFQHSIQVSTLAAEAANRVGASAQLVRTAALYHDIGKLANPPFFVENQTGTNPHEKLKPEESAGIILRHVNDGLKLAEKYGLPSAIRDFIDTHHGSGIAKFFYVKYQQNNPDVEADPSQFRYTGTNPTTKETAILMMADSVEAASRSLVEYTEESIAAMVDRIIDTQLSEGFFKESPLTFKEIIEIKEIFKEKLKTMYHTRISYPELKPETYTEPFKRGPRRRKY